MRPKFELNHLKYFYFTVLEGGLAPAAERLHVQQPVVSKMIKSLEGHLGQPLFYKSGRQKTLTDYGQLIFRHCQTIFDEIHKISDHNQDTKNLSGVSNLACTEPVTNFIATKICAQLMNKYPKVNFNLYTSTQSHLLEMLSKGKVSVGCLFYVQQLASDLEIVRRIPVKHHVVIKSALKNNRAVIESFIGSREIDNNNTRHFPTVEFLRKNYYKNTRIIFSSNSLTLHKALVLQGKGISVLPGFMIEEELKDQTLIDLFPEKNFTWDLKVIKKKSDQLTIPEKTFIELLACIENSN